MFEWVKRLFDTERYNQASVRILEGTGQHGAKQWDFNQKLAVRAFGSWVYSAASINAYACASTPLRLYVRNDKSRHKAFNTSAVGRRRKNYLLGDSTDAARPSVHTMRKIIEFGTDFEEVTDSHPVTNLLTKANEFYNGFDLTTLRILYGELTGNAYQCVILDDRLGIPSEIFPMPSQWTFVNPDRDGFVKSYTYGAPGNEDLEFEKDEVIHFKRPNPKDLFYGMGKVEAAWGTININQAIHDMDQASFANHARPDYAVVVKNGANTNQLERFESYVQEQLQGTKKAGKFLTMTGDVQLTPLNFPPKDMAGREDVVEEIAAVFGVPVSLLKANDPNLASARVGYSQWREGTILPLLRMDEDVLNQVLLPMFGLQDDAVLAYDNPVPADKEFELGERTTLVASGLLTINEAREEDGREPFEEELAEQPLVGGMPLGGAQPDPFAALMGGGEQPNGQVPGNGTPEGAMGPPDEKGGQLPGLVEETPQKPSAAALNGGQVSSVLATLDGVREGKIASVAATELIAATGIEPEAATRMVEAQSPQLEPTNPVNGLPKQNQSEEEKCPDDSERDYVISKDEDACVADKIGKLVDEGYEKEQAVAIAREMCSKAVTEMRKELEESIDWLEDASFLRSRVEIEKALLLLEGKQFGSLLSKGQQ